MKWLIGKIKGLFLKGTSRAVEKTAKVSSQSISWFIFYQPKEPKCLRKF